MIKGDTPLNVKWLKNGVLIDPSQRISITQVDQYNSILVIEHLSASHSGNYSCVVSNAAADVESTQALLVNGKKNPENPSHCERNCGEARGARRLERFPTKIKNKFIWEAQQMSKIFTILGSSIWFLIYIFILLFFLSLYNSIHSSFGRHFSSSRTRLNSSPGDRAVCIPRRLVRRHAYANDLRSFARRFTASIDLVERWRHFIAIAGGQRLVSRSIYFYS